MSAPDLSEGKAEQTIVAAAEALRPMLPTLTGYARAMTDSPEAEVVLGGTTMTDGKRITIRPPLILASDPAHDRLMCGRRDHANALRCPACRMREDILVKMRHEIGHIVHGSFVPFPYSQTFLTSMATEAGLGHLEILNEYGKKCTVLTWGARCRDKNIGTLTMVLEDVRIDQCNATRSSGGAEAYRVFLAGVLAHGMDGQGPAARDRGFREQVMLGLLSAPHGVDVAGLLDSKVIEILSDAEVARILDMGNAAVHEVLPAAYKLYRRLIDLGVFPEPEEQESQDDTPQGRSEDDGDAGTGEPDADEPDAGGPDADPQEDGGEVGDSGDGEGGEGDPLDAGQQCPGERGESEVDHDDEAGAGGKVAQDGGQEADPEGLHRLVRSITGHDFDLDNGVDVSDELFDSTMQNLETHLDKMGGYRPSVGRVSIFGRCRPEGQGPLHGSSGRQETLSAADPTEAQLGALVGRARHVFRNNAALKRQRDMTRGRVSPTLLGKRAWNPDDQRLFERRSRENVPSYSVLVGMDNSGSTSAGIRAKLLRETALATAMMCQRVGVEVSVYAHTTGSYRDLDLYEIKAPSAPWTPKIGDDLRHLKIGATNLDGSTMTTYRRILSSSTATRKVLLYFTDGEIPGAGGQVEADIMRDEVRLCRRQGVTLLGVGVLTSSPEKFGIPTVRLDKPEDVGRVLSFLAKEFGI